jgi:hypothetical protein
LLMRVSLLARYGYRSASMLDGFSPAARLIGWRAGK